MVSMEMISRMGKEVYDLMAGHLETGAFQSSFQDAVKDEVTQPSGALYACFLSLYEAKEKVQALLGEEEIPPLEQMMICQDQMEETLCIKAFCYGYLFALGQLKESK